MQIHSLSELNQDSCRSHCQWVSAIQCIVHKSKKRVKYVDLYSALSRCASNALLLPVSRH